MLEDSQIKDVIELTDKLKLSTTFHAVPALMQLIVSHIKDLGNENEYDGIKDVYIGGDSVPSSILEDLPSVFRKANVHVLYGPTEGTIFTTSNHSFLEKRKSLKGSIIGKPNPNSNIYILDGKENLCAIGVTGEICIGGGGVARGYLNQKELTDSKFTNNPFESGGRIYKTGDLGRWLSDGSIEFMGRRDNQVKIRGYRIELNEIEESLAKFPSIEMSVVLALANEDKTKELVAYVVGSNIDLNELRSFLAQKLPAYMIPSYFVVLPELPLTANGKVDRKKLSDRKQYTVSKSSEFIAPRNEIETSITEIWKEILNLNEVGVKDDFFELGGDSIKLGRLVSKISKAYFVKMNFQNLFVEPTVESIAAQITFMLDQRKKTIKREDFVEIDL